MNTLLSAIFKFCTTKNLFKSNQFHPMKSLLVDAAASSAPTSLLILLIFLKSLISI